MICSAMAVSFSFRGVLVFWGCGTSASRRFGETGVMAMKMISSTSRMSIIGVTLMSEESPPPPPVENDMCISSMLQAQPQGPGRLLLHAAGNRVVRLFGQHAQRVHARGADVIDRFHDHAVVRAGICAQKDLFVGLVLQHIGDAGAQIARG